MQRQPLREKVSVSVCCFQICLLKKLNIAILNPNYLKTYRTPLRKFQAPEEIINPMKLVMLFTKLKRLHKRVMNRHHFSSDLGNCVDRFVCKCSDDF